MPTDTFYKLNKEKQKTIAVSSKTSSPTAIKEDYDPSKEYIAPYPQYADQAHLNAAGYARIGECIAAAAELA